MGRGALVREMAVKHTSPLLDQCRQELTFELIRASGPGGQNVNKVSTALQLRFDITRSRVLSPVVKLRLRRLGGQRVTKDGVLVLRARRFRTQENNRQDALDRFAAMLEKALAAPKPRRPSAPTTASRERRLRIKKHRSDIKRTRRTLSD